MNEIIYTIFKLTRILYIKQKDKIKRFYKSKFTTIHNVSTFSVCPSWNLLSNFCETLQPEEAPGAALQIQLC